MPGAFHGQIIRSRHDEQQVDGPPFVKNRDKPLTVSACHKHDEPSILVLGQLHGRQSVQATNSHVHVNELPALLYGEKR